jgi:CRP-like cAMP-binding protein
VEQNVAEILHHCRLFAKVQPDGFQRLATMARLVRFEKGRIIFREGDECPGVYVVGSGLVRVFKTAPNGKEHVLHMVGPGLTFAEVAAIGGYPCPAAAESVTPTLCALLPLDRFKEALAADHPLCLGMMIGLTQWIHHLVGMLEDVALRDAAGRLARFLLGLPTAPGELVELPMLKRHLASHLNLTSETFSRSIRRLVNAGVLAQPDTARLKIVDRKKLERIAAGKTWDDEA